MTITLILIWFAVVSALQFAVNFLRPQNLGRGLLSRLMTRCFYPRAWWRPRLPVVLSRMLLSYLAPVACFLIGLVSENSGLGLLCLSSAVFYLDDYLFGDDDRSRRLWAGIKNRVQWKMELPQPVKDAGSV